MHGLLALAGGNHELMGLGLQDYWSALQVFIHRYNVLYHEVNPYYSFRRFLGTEAECRLLRTCLFDIASDTLSYEEGSVILGLNLNPTMVVTVASIDHLRSVRVEMQETSRLGPAAIRAFLESRTAPCARDEDPGTW